MSINSSASETTNTTSYVFHMVQTKPVAVVFATVCSTVLAKVTGFIPDAAVSMGALTLLVMIDWFTKIRALRKQALPVTSQTMRQRGFFKLRDYLVLYIAGALTQPLMGDTWGYRTVMFVMAIWELWSIAENLYDGGTIPFDIRKVALFDGVRQIITGGIMQTPYTPTSHGGSGFSYSSGVTATGISMTPPGTVPTQPPPPGSNPGGNLPI